MWTEHALCMSDIIAAQKCPLFSASVYVCVAMVSSWHKHVFYCIDKCPVHFSAFMFVFFQHMNEIIKNKYWAMTILLLFETDPLAIYAQNLM